MRRTVWILLFVAALVVILPQFAIPLALPADTVHAPVPASLGEPATWPYAFGALVCHQRPDRSFTLAGNQLPVCERCLAIELGMAAAFAAAVLVAPRGGFVASLSAFLPERLRSTAGVLAVGLLLMLPMVLDGGLQTRDGLRLGHAATRGTGFLYGIGQAGIVIGIAAWLVTVRSESLMPSRGR